MELEEEFDISIPEDAAEKIQRVGEAVDYIERKTKATKSYLLVLSRSGSKYENAVLVITGLGVVTPLGCNVDLLWSRILEGASGIHALTILDTTPHKVKFGGDIGDFDPGDSVEPKEVKRLDRFTLFALHAAQQAVRDSGLELGREDPFPMRCHQSVRVSVG